MAFYQFQVPTKIIFNPGISRDFAHECQLLGIDNLFVVTDKALLDLGLVTPITEALKTAGLTIAGIFSDVPSDSSVATVTKCAALAKETGAAAFLAIGGGSVMDTAKGANILFTLGGNLKADYSGAQTITQNLSPLVAIPTTAGTGSEVTEAIVIYDEESKTKLSFVDAHLLPTLAVLDPELTVKLPAKLTAATGLDALTHAMESIVSIQHSPVSDALALEAIRLVHKSLLACVKNGADIEARADLMAASNLAGIAFNHAMVGVVHAIAHSIGAVAHVHHGLANGIILPFGLEYNLEVAADRIALIAPALGLIAKNDDEAAKLVITKVRTLLTEIHNACGMPITLGAAGVKQEQLARIVELACEDGAGFYNPRPVEEGAVMDLLKRAF